MAGKKRKWLRIPLWIFGGIAGLIVLLILAFYLGRGWITRQFLDRFNEEHPGEVQLGAMNLIPLMDFPQAVIQFRDIVLYEHPVREDSLHQEPVIYLHEFFVSLGIRELLRGEFSISQLRLENGFIRYEVYADSISNLEKALGIYFGTGDQDTVEENRIDRLVNLEEVHCRKIMALYRDEPGRVDLNLQIVELESTYRQKPDTLETDIKVTLDVNKFKYQTYNIENKDNIEFSGGLVMDRTDQVMEVEPTALKVSGLELETWGQVELGERPKLNMAFRASNSGLEVLNTLFLGILDLDEIRQTGAGNIHLNGRITGELGRGIPEVVINGSAEDLRFEVLALDREVSGLGFELFASSGGESDFSAARLELRDFRADFPEGRIRGDLIARNLVKPYLDLDLSGELDLHGLESMVRIDSLSELEGQLKLQARMKGEVNSRSNEFLGEGGSLWLDIRNGRGIYGKDTLSGVNGELYMEDSVLGSRGMMLCMNGSWINLDLHAENLLHYFLGFDRPVNAGIEFSSREFYPARFTGDTALSSMIGDVVRDLDLGLDLRMEKSTLDSLLHGGAINDLEIRVRDLGVSLPVYEEITGLNAILGVRNDSLLVEQLEGRIGSSSFSMSAGINSLAILSGRDSTSALRVEVDLGSDLLQLSDLLLYRGEALVLEEFLSEHLEDFHLRAGAEFMPAKVEGGEQEINLIVKDLKGQLKYYPLEIRNVSADIGKWGEVIHIRHFMGEAGGNNLECSGIIGNFSDSLREHMYGSLDLKSDFLDLDALTDYRMPGKSGDNTDGDSLKVKQVKLLHAISYPDFSLDLDVRELHFEGNILYGLNGRLRTSAEKVFRLDQLRTLGKSGGSIELSGEFDVSDSMNYVCKAQVKLDTMHIRDIHLEMESEEGSYLLEENFAGIVSGRGGADLYFTTDLKLDLEQTAANFTVEVRNGALINFTPLEAAGKFLNNKDLDLVRFSSMYNSFTLKDGKVEIPLMTVESSLGLMLIEGEQGLDNTYLYLLRMPMWLVKDAALSIFSRAADDDKEDEIRKMEMGTFMNMTTWDRGNGDKGTSLGDRMDKHR